MKILKSIIAFFLVLSFGILICSKFLQNNKEKFEVRTAAEDGVTVDELKFNDKLYLAEYIDDHFVVNDEGSSTIPEKLDVGDEFYVHNDLSGMYINSTADDDETKISLLDYLNFNKDKRKQGELIIYKNDGEASDMTNDHLVVVGDVTTCHVNNTITKDGNMISLYFSAERTDSAGGSSINRYPFILNCSQRPIAAHPNNVSVAKITQDWAKPIHNVYVYGRIQLKSDSNSNGYTVLNTGFWILENGDIFISRQGIEYEGEGHAALCRQLASGGNDICGWSLSATFPASMVEE